MYQAIGIQGKHKKCDFSADRFLGDEILPLLVLTCRGTAPVKTNTDNDFPENSQKLLPVLVLNSGDVSALQCCTSNFLWLRALAMGKLICHSKDPDIL